MIFKRTKAIMSARGAVNWARGYANEVAKHAQGDVADLGIRLGREYLTSRPAGQLSAHGYVKEKVKHIKAVSGLSDTEAAVEFIRMYCRDRERRGRKIFGLRAVASMDPAQTMPLIEKGGDLDVVLVRTLESTFAEVAARHYPGDKLGFFLGIHHDKFHLHGHLYVMPQTRAGRRVSMSNRTHPGGADAPRVDMLDEFRRTYAKNVTRALLETKLELGDLLRTPDWNALGRLAALSTIEPAEHRTRAMNDESRRRFTINLYLLHLRSLDRPRVAGKLQRLRDALARRATLDKQRDILAPLTEDWTAVQESWVAGVALRHRLWTEAICGHAPARQRSGVVGSYPLRPKFIAVRQPILPPQHAPVRQRLDELGRSRLASRISLLGIIADMELILGAATQSLPGWIRLLEECVATDRLPNRSDLLPVDQRPIENHEEEQVLGAEQTSDIGDSPLDELPMIPTDRIQPLINL